MSLSPSMPLRELLPDSVVTGFFYCLKRLTAYSVGVSTAGNKGYRYCGKALRIGKGGEVSALERTAYGYVRLRPALKEPSVFRDG